MFQTLEIEILLSD